MIVYVDTSILIRRLMGEPNAYPLSQCRAILTSEITRIESLRAIDRLRIEARWAAAMVMERIRVLTASMALLREVPLQPPILRRAAEPFPTIIKTLDALHVATALLVSMQMKQPCTFLTHDRRQGIAAQTVGLLADGF
ncbi:MAG: type II toxin-antitoxin system VapC family toxin [Deltaproteobacteria bacterium]|nr:type II toxin-antitoxin system VapC family toxin [Deltaproteobacteria bacterium]